MANVEQIKELQMKRMLARMKIVVKIPVSTRLRLRACAVLLRLAKVVGGFSKVEIITDET